MILNETALKLVKKSFA